MARNTRLTGILMIMLFGLIGLTERESGIPRILIAVRTNLLKGEYRR